MKPQAKHTPGPWQYTKGTRHVHYLNPEIEAGNEEIDDPRHDSVVADCGTQWPWSNIPDDEREANAALIARAPEMVEQIARLEADKAELLEALENLVGQSECINPGRTHVKELCAVCQARAAIAKHGKGNTK